MHTLLAGATLQDARVLLVGDEKQLGSVEAGRAFAQLQEAGMPTFRLTEIVRQSNEATKEAVYAALQADAAKALQAIERGGGEVVEIKGKSHEAGCARPARLPRRALCRAVAGGAGQDGAGRSLARGPQGAQRAGARRRCRREASCRGRSSTLDILVPKGLTPGEQKQPVFYERGDVVSLPPRAGTRTSRTGWRRAHSYRVAGTDQHGGRLQLQKEDGSFVIWRPGSHGARDAEVYRREQRELAAGDRITWTKNLPGSASPTARAPPSPRSIRPEGSFTIERNGRQTTLEASSAEARHLEHGYAQTAQKLQGQTAERALIHAEHWRLNLINQRSFYVLLSRAKDGVSIATSDRTGLIEAIRERSGEQQAALDRLEVSQAPEIARTAMQEVTQERERERQQQRRAAAAARTCPAAARAHRRRHAQAQARRPRRRSRPGA